MSVDVKTPTKAQFEITEFPCGDRTPNNRTGSEKIQPSMISNGESNQQVLQSQVSGGLDPAGRTRRRRNTISERPSHSNNNSLAFKRRFGKQNREKKMVLPSKFLLGGNIGDPLNLNSLCDEAINKALNENTPVNSPLPLPPHRQQVQVLIPANINDPLNLTGEDVDLVSPKGNKKKRNKHKHKRKGSGTDTNIPLSGNEVSEKEEVVSPIKDFTKPIAIEIIEESQTNQASKSVTGLGAKLQKIVDKIVSPVIPQMSPKSRNKRKRTTSDSKSDASGPSCKISHKEETDKSFRSEKSSSPIRPKRQISNQAARSSLSRQKKKPKVFKYGNYNRYYGYRNPEMENDPRLKCFVSDWFQGKDVLDIGCNVGHVTLAIAHEHEPRKVVGIDIDGQLIAAARRNVRHYLSHEYTHKYPVSMETCYGPVAAPGVCDPGERPKFPENVSFLQSNYVLERNELLDLVKEEYDVVLALSITKWWHLNYGDDGLKRAFKRIFRQLRPGGRLILEPQSWASYKKKKKITEDIYKTYQSIKFRPSQFSEYLMSREVGFSTCETIDMPFNRQKGFQRPIQIYTKTETCFNTPLRELAISRSNTPFVDVLLRTGNSVVNTPIGTPRSGCATPQFTVGSGNVTPNTDVDSSVCTSCQLTPSTETVTPNKTPVNASCTLSDARPLCDIKSLSAPAMLVSDCDITKPDMTLKNKEKAEEPAMDVDKTLNASEDPK